MNFPAELFAVVFIFGMVIGSFLNVLIYRLPREKSPVAPRSSCPSCGRLIAWYENIPLVSYIVLRGRCSGCNSRISLKYPLTEVLFGFIAILLLPRYFSGQALLLYTFHFSVLAVFWVHFLIDLEHKLLPDSLNLYLGVVFLMFAILHYGWMHWVLGGLIGFFVPFGVTWFFYKFRGKVGLGGGDIKLYAALGIFLGPQGVIQNIFMSCSLGAIVGIVMIVAKKMDKDHPMPFGPFIIGAAVLQIYFPFIPKLLF